MTGVASSIFSSINLDQILMETGDKITVDAGHLCIGNMEGCFVAGKCGRGPSETEQATFDLGFQIANHLIALGKQCSVHLCFSDTSKNFQNLQQRDELKTRIEEGNVDDVIPWSYKKCREAYPHVPIHFSLQTQNSNLFAARIKKVKQQIKACANIASVFQQYQAIFIRDAASDLFGFIHPYLLDIEQEILLMKGDWWLDENAVIHPADQVRSPAILLKKMGVVNLHSKSAGILCPGTYAGLLLAIPPDQDRIALYARNDDDAIGEKVLRGMIASYVLMPELRSNSFLFTISKNLKKLEISQMNRPILRSSKIKNSSELIEAMKARNLHQTYQGYFHEIPLF